MPAPLPTLRRTLAVALVLAAACGRQERVTEVTTTTVALPAPGDDEGAIEPHLIAERSRPNRVLVGAQYGTGYNGGGRHVWTWTSPDAAENWSGEEIPLPWPNADLAADVVTAADAEGRAYLTYVAADMKAGQSAVVLTRADSLTAPFDSARVIATGRLTDSLGVVDKPWIAVDRGASSPREGTVYLAWHLQKPGSGGDTRTTLWLAASTDGGRTFGPPVRVADRASGHIAVRANGAVDAVYQPSGRPVLLHARSDDGGKTFSAPDTVVALTGATQLETPHVAPLAGGDSAVACWAQGEPNERRRSARCAVAAQNTWGEPVDVAPAAGAAVSVSHPSVGASLSGIWVAAYRSDADSTAAVLYRSTDGGRTFAEHLRMASRPFGLDRFCSSPAAECRRAPREQGVFFPGDYIGLVALDLRTIAAFVLPEGSESTGRPTVHVTFIRFPRSTLRRAAPADSAR
jgi:hypothetical protein